MKIQKKAMPLNDPLFSKEAVDQYTDRKLRKQDNSKKKSQYMCYEIKIE